MAISLITGLALAATAASAGGQVYSGISQKKAAGQAATAAQAAAESQAQLSEYNAGVADLQAADVMTQAAREAAKIRAGVRQVQGAQRTGMAAGNIDVSTGSAADVQTDAAYVGSLDAVTIHNNAMRQAWGYKVQAEDLRREAEITRKTGAAQAAGLNAQGSAAFTSSLFGAANTLLGGTSMLAQRYGFSSGSSLLPSRTLAQSTLGAPSYAPSFPG